jgi:hypothetical protein
MLVGFDISASNYWAIILCLVAASGYALGPIIITKMLSDVASIGVIAWSLLGSWLDLLTSRCLRSAK